MQIKPLRKDLEENIARHSLKRKWDKAKEFLKCMRKNSISENEQFVFQVGISGTPPKDVAKRVENKITFKYLKDNFSASISK